MRCNIPIMMPVQNVTVERTDFDPTNMVTITLPAALQGKVVLRRDLFSQKMLDWVDRVDSPSSTPNAPTKVSMVKHKKWKKRSKRAKKKK